MVLGFDRVEEYVACPAFVGGIVGRVANRIANGRFELGGQRYELDTNDGPHHLHGGHAGWDKALWRFEATSSGDDAESAWLRLSHDSADGEGRYPGRIRAEIEFRVTGSALSITMLGTTDRPTLMNLAHHGYFNLAVRVAAACSITSSCCTQTSARRAWCPTATSYRSPARPSTFGARSAWARILPEREGAPRGYDDNFIVRGSATSGEVRPVALLTDPISGRTMEVSADQPGVQLYTGNYLDGTLRGKQRSFSQYAAVCLETQAFPNAIDVPDWRSQVILNPGQQYRHVQVFRFGGSSVQLP